MLIRCNSPQPEQIENPFDFDCSKLKQLNLAQHDPLLGQALCLSQARQKNNLRANVQRVCFYLNANNAEAVYGALLDLFVVLQQKGKPLRKRLFNRSHTLFSDEQRSVFEVSLHGDSQLSEAPYSEHSIFYDAIPRRQLITQQA